jgi:hypothetical protein
MEQNGITGEEPFNLEQLKLQLQKSSTTRRRGALQALQERLSNSGRHSPTSSLITSLADVRQIFPRIPIPP